MKTYLIHFSILVFSFISCSSEGPSEITSAHSAFEDIEVTNENSLLWKIEKEGYETSYMYGTMHIIESDYYHFTDPMTERIEASDAIIMEVDGMPNPLETLSLMSLDTGDIRGLFSDEEMQIIVGFFDKELGMKPDIFFKIYGEMKPFFILQGITQHYFSNETESYDLEIMGIAGSNEIPIIGLETIKQQLGFFDVIPQSGMNKLIIESIENFEKEKKDTQKMMKLYAEQKVDKLIPLMSKQSPEFMEYEDVFLYNRNKAWIPKLTNEMQTKKCFVAVGAAHLFGDGGLIDLLEKEGFTLTAISTES